MSGKRFVHEYGNWKLKEIERTHTGAASERVARTNAIKRALRYYQAGALDTEDAMRLLAEA